MPCVLQLDLTKTTDGKASFLHVLADVIYTKSRDCVNLSEELPTVAEAAKGLLLLLKLLLEGN